MATAEDIALLRTLIAESNNVAPWDDATLETYIDNADSDLNLAAANVWTAKAAAAADLVDVSEGGSSRKLGDLYEQALSMAKFYGGQVSGGTGPDAPRYARQQRLVR